MHVLASTLTMCDPDVRARAYRAFAVKARATLGERAERVIAGLDKILARYTGIDLADVPAWAAAAPCEATTTPTS